MPDILRTFKMDNHTEGYNSTRLCCQGTQAAQGCQAVYFFCGVFLGFFFCWGGEGGRNCWKYALTLSAAHKVYLFCARKALSL